MTPKLTALGIAMLMFFQLYSQTIEKELPGQDWRIIPALPNQNLLMTEGSFALPLLNGDFSASEVMVSPTEVVALTVYKKKEYSVRKITSKLQVKWNTALTAVPLFIGQINGNIVVITTPDYKLLGWENNFEGWIIDAKTGKVITKKMLYKGNDDILIEPKLLVSPSGDQFYLGIRETALSKGIKIMPFGIGYNKTMDNYVKTSSLTFFTVNDKLDIISTAKISINEEENFINCGITLNKELVIATNTNADIKVEKFDLTSGKSNGKLVTSIDTKDDKRLFSPNLFVSKKDPNRAYMTIEFVNHDKNKTAGLYGFDFSSKKILRNEQVFDKAYKKETRNEYKEVGKKQDKPDFDRLDDLRFTTLLEYNDQLVVLKEIKYSYTEMGNGSKAYSTYFNTDALLTIYDARLQPTSQQFIPKNNVSPINLGLSSAMHIKDDKLHIVSGFAAKGTAYAALYSSCNLKTGELQTSELVAKQEIGKKYPPDSPATVWFDDGIHAELTWSMTVRLPRISSRTCKKCSINI
jgi:hypothetical protein